jgi:hypothetical protein
LPLGGGYIILDDEDALVLLRRGIRIDGEILNLLLGGHVGVHGGEFVDPFPLGGHIIVGDGATLLLLLVGGVRVDGEVLVV